MGRSGIPERRTKISKTILLLEQENKSDSRRAAQRRLASKAMPDQLFRYGNAVFSKLTKR
jgi:hypothetical protein